MRRYKLSQTELFSVSGGESTEAREQVCIDLADTAGQVVRFCSLEAEPIGKPIGEVGPIDTAPIHDRAKGKALYDAQLKGYTSVKSEFNSGSLKAIE